jgi:hypothetical protein
MATNEHRTASYEVRQDHANSPRSVLAIVAAHPRPDFKRRILNAFTEGIEHRPHTTSGNIKADVLERFVPGFQRLNFVEIIENSHWPE